MPSPRLALAGPVAAAIGVLLLAATNDQLAAVAALTLVGAGTSLLTTRLFPRFMDATPPEMLARFSALLGVAQTGPVLLATPALGHLIGTLGMGVALNTLAAVLFLTLFAARRADTQLRDRVAGDPDRVLSQAAAPHGGEVQQ